MYRLTTPQGESYLTEKVNYIRKHDSGVYLLTDAGRAEGVAYRGTPYLFRDGAQVCEVDAGETVHTTEKTVSDNDAMNVDQEYRLTLLELGLNE
nr:MAG TPA: hypothetical protein [Caudoviricetes sp.]